MDDAALSCGQLLSASPGSHVVTVFSGGPARVRPLPWWDKMSGSFQPGDDVMALRAVEDDGAWAVAGVHGHRLGFWDEQYREGRRVALARLRPRAVRAAQARVDDPGVEEAVYEMLRTVIDELGLQTWLVPLGLWHGDHKKTARACLRLARSMPDRRWVVYEELPYRLEVPLEVSDAKARLRAIGFAIEPAVLPSAPDSSQKRAMVDCYRSQLPCLGARADAAVTGPELFHHLSDRSDQASPGGAPTDEERLPARPAVP